MPPVDYRYGHNLDGRFGQGRTLWALLLYGVYAVVAAPTCTPWSANSRAWDPTVRFARRNSEKSCLYFLAVVILVQSLPGRYFVVENPLGSDIWTQSPLAPVMDLGRLVTADQCEYGAEISGEPVRKSTQFFTNLPDFRADSRCAGNHSHRQFTGKVGSADRTAIAAVYPEELCTSILDSIIASTRCCAGGRSTVAI